MSEGKRLFIKVMRESLPKVCVLMLQSSIYWCLPHVSGGVSECFFIASPTGLSSPREWGCFLEYVAPVPSNDVIPTRVGGGRIAITPKVLQPPTGIVAIPRATSFTPRPVVIIIVRTVPKHWHQRKKCCHQGTGTVGSAVHKKMKCATRFYLLTSGREPAM